MCVLCKLNRTDVPRCFHWLSEVSAVLLNGSVVVIPEYFYAIVLR